MNATTQTVPSTSATPTPPPPTSTSTPFVDHPRPEPVPPPASGAVEGTPVPSASSQSKRKLRSTRGDEGNKRSRTGTGNTSKEYAPPTVRLSDLGGVDPCVEKMLELVAMPLTHPEVYLHTGVQPPRGVLLHGPPGCGKTMLANAIGGVRHYSNLAWQQHELINRCVSMTRNWVCHLSQFRLLQSSRECRGNQKRRYVKLSKRPRYVILLFVRSQVTLTLDSRLL